MASSGIFIFVMFRLSTTFFVMELSNKIGRVEINIYEIEIRGNLTCTAPFACSETAFHCNGGKGAHQVLPSSINHSATQLYYPHRMFFLCYSIPGFQLYNMRRKDSTLIPTTIFNNYRFYINNLNKNACIEENRMGLQEYIS